MAAGNDGSRLPTRCAICGTFDAASVVYPANFDPSAFNADVFSARRLPDRIHYRVVRCDRCGLLRSDPVADPAMLAKLYASSRFNYDREVSKLSATYGRYLAKLGEYGVQKGSLLEVGCGNGFFLETALELGYQQVTGIEPSVEAVSKASSRIRPHLVCDIMRPGVFPANTFDVACVFQTFDHISDPGGLLDECLNVLKPGGFLLCLNHNAEAISARLLGERSPIIDIEHTYLYGPDTMTRIFELHGFKVRHVGRVWNDYALRYLARLLPLPAGMKSALVQALTSSVAGAIQLRVPLGNLYLVAQKPGAG